MTYLAPCRTLDEAREFLALVADPRASHNCWAAVDAADVGQCSDDGEPNGTAGKPMKSVLESEGRCGAVVVVTRYFGGTKFGTGGLVRAYGACAEAAVASAAWEPVVARRWLRVTGVPPSGMARLYALVGDGGCGAELVGDIVCGKGGAVEATFAVSVEHARQLEGDLGRLGSGAAAVQRLAGEAPLLQFCGAEAWR